MSGRAAAILLVSGAVAFQACNSGAVDSGGGPDGSALGDTSSGDTAAGPGDEVTMSGPEITEPDGLGPDGVETDDVTSEVAEHDVLEEDHIPPSVSFVDLFNGETLSGAAPISVATDDDVVRVAYALNGTPQADGTVGPGFTWLWDTTVFASGNYVLSAVAHDGAGNKSEPAVVEIVVDNTDPTKCAFPQVNIIYPTSDAEVCGKLDVEAAVSGACGIERAEFFVDEKKQGEATDAPFRFAWQTTSLADGPHTLRVAAEDVDGQKAHQLITVNVNNAISPCDNPPTVSFIHPDDGAYVDGIVAIEVKASDDAAATHVQFSVDGAGLADDNSFPYKYDWNTADVDETVHTLRAIAFDTSGKTGQRQIQVVVDRTNPTVELISPSALAVVNGDVLVVADASDSAALDRVELRVDGSLVGTATEAPFQATWSATGESSGTHDATATAIDRAGHQTTATRSFILDRPPTIALLSPSGGGNLEGVVTVTADAFDAEAIQSVSIRIDDQTLDSDFNVGSTASTLTTSWDTKGAAFGEHIVSAEVMDDQGQTATISRTVTVDQPLLVALNVCNPDTSGCVVAPASEVFGTRDLIAVATDDNATPTKMVFEVDGQQISTLTKAPFTFAWDSASVTDGSHTVSVYVTSSLGDEESASVTVTVNNCDRDHDTYGALGGACGGADCNDKVSGTHPGASDTVGNGVDDNCDGKDGVDKDGDKHASAASGGADCDDASDATYPGAEDLFGDTKDQDCDGADGVDSDHDLHASIASGGDDCDESRPDVYGGAPDLAGASCTQYGVVTSTIASAGDVGSYSGIAVDGAGKLHAALYDATTNKLGYATNAGGTFVTEVADGTPGTGQYASLALTSVGKPVLTYYDATATVLKVASKATGSWVVTTADPKALTGQHTSVAVDANGKVHVAYYDFGSYDLRYATDASGAFSAETVDTPGDVGEYASLVLGAGGQVHIAYYDRTNKDLKLAVGGSGSWTVSVADSAGDVGQYASLALDKVGRHHIAAYLATTKDVRYVTDVGGSWAGQSVVTTGSVGKYTALGLTALGPAIAFVDDSAGLHVTSPSAAGWTVAKLDGALAKSVRAINAKTGALLVSFYAPTGEDLKLATATCSAQSAAGLDESCDGVDGVDTDGDKHASTLSGGLDCRDDDVLVFPCADDLAGDGKDANCDGQDALSCDDCSPCTADEEAGGACQHTVTGSGGACDDGDLCTAEDKCEDGKCTSGAAVQCNDGNPCTTDACAAGTGCTAAPLSGGVCPGGNCVAGECCVPQCDAKQCGNNGCGGSCGQCAGGQTCSNAGQCVDWVDAGMVKVPAGPFPMGCNPSVDSECSNDEYPQHTVSLNTFEIDTTEVTVAAYTKCVNSGTCSIPSSGGCGGYQNWGKAARAEHPVNCTTWFDAAQYCAFVGKRLCTEAEWEKAARGPDGRKYPWGSADASCEYAVMYQEIDPEVAGVDSGDGCYSDSTWAVGSKPAGASPYGAMDMAGNVSELTADWYDSSYYSVSPSTNPQGPSAAHSYLVARGGSFVYGSSVRASDRLGVSFPGSATTGFRCCRSYLDSDCIPECAGKACGDNGCGGSCGECKSGIACSPEGKCDVCPNGACNKACLAPPEFGVAKTHVVSMAYPGQTADFDCDSNGDGFLDAADGNLNQMFENMKAVLPISGSLAANIAEGDIVLLADLNGSWKGGQGSDLFVNFYKGTAVNPSTSCTDWYVTGTNSNGEATGTTWDGQSSCDWELDATSFSPDTGCPRTTIPGAVVSGGSIDAGPVDFNFPLLPFPFEVPIGHGRFHGDVTDAFRVTDGRLCGEVPYVDLKEAFDLWCSAEPEQYVCGFKAIMLGVIKAGCNEGGTQCSVILHLETAQANSFSVAD